MQVKTNRLKTLPSSTASSRINSGDQLPLIPSQSSSLEAWCRLIRDRRWSRQQKKQLLDHYQNPQAILDAPVFEARALISGKLCSASANVDEADIRADVEWLSEHDQNLVSMLDAHYPESLLHLPDPPIALFLKGHSELLSEPQVSIVGSRSPTPVGKKVAASLARDLSLAGITIISGMALGIDGVAHTGALDAQGSSIAVLGNGLDIVYPARNRTLFERLANNGLLLSEYPLGVRPDRYTFPQRNRIVSGLAHGIIIVEAAERSGTLITARLGLEQNKEVMVVPGSALSAQYRGSHQLINQGASLVSEASDVLMCLSQELSAYRLKAKPDNVSDGEIQASSEGVQNPLLEFISSESTSVDDIISSSQLTSAEVSSMLLELELIGAVAIASDGGYVNLS